MKAGTSIRQIGFITTSLVGGVSIGSGQLLVKYIMALDLLHCGVAREYASATSTVVSRIAAKDSAIERINTSGGFS
jgi:hypothetical protein